MSGSEKIIENIHTAYTHTPPLMHEVGCEICLSRNVVIMWIFILPVIGAVFVSFLKNAYNNYTSGSNNYSNNNNYSQQSQDNQGYGYNNNNNNQGGYGQNGGGRGYNNGDARNRQNNQNSFR